MPSYDEEDRHVQHPDELVGKLSLAIDPDEQPRWGEHPGTPMSELSSDGMGALIALGRGKASGQSAAR